MCTCVCLLYAGRKDNEKFRLKLEWVGMLFLVKEIGTEKVNKENIL